MVRVSPALAAIMASNASLMQSAQIDLLPRVHHYGAGKPSLKRKTRGKGQRKF